MMSAFSRVLGSPETSPGPVPEGGLGGRRVSTEISGFRPLDSVPAGGVRHAERAASRRL